MDLHAEKAGLTRTVLIDQLGEEEEVEGGAVKIQAFRRTGALAGCR